MKKIICLLLVLASTFALFSCSLIDKIRGDGGDGDETNATVATIRNIVDTSLPTKIVTKTEYVGTDTLIAKYTTQIDRTSGNSQFDFEYQRYAKIEEMLPSNIKTVAGTVWYDKDGNVSQNSGETWVAEDVSGYLPYSLNIEEARFVSFDITDGGNDLKAEIAPSEAKRTLGADISAEGNIVIEIDTNGQYLYSVKIYYTAKDTGATVVVNSSYDYSLITVDFDSAE